MKRYAITEGLGAERALRFARWNLDRAVDMLQIREKQLTARELLALVEEVMRLPNPAGTKILVNARLDIALAAKAHGVHFPANSKVVGHASRLVLALANARGSVRLLNHDGTEVDDADFCDLVLGVSCHSILDLQQAAIDQVDFAVFGPVFATGDKPPQGLSVLRAACAASSIPVYALGGIHAQNAPACIETGAIGIAGISLFRPIAE